MYREARIAEGLCQEDGTLNENMKKLAKIPLCFPPGEQWRYGMSSDVLGRVVEVASGMSFDDFLKKRLFEPLKMIDTHFFLPPEKVNRLAAVYRLSKKGKLERLAEGQVYHLAVSEQFGFTYSDKDGFPFSIDYPYRGPRKYFSGSAGMCSTVPDYSRFCQMLLNGGELEGQRVLKPETVKLATSNQIGSLEVSNAPHEGNKFGLGFSIFDADRPRPAPQSAWRPWLGRIFPDEFSHCAKRRLDRGLHDTGGTGREYVTLDDGDSQAGGGDDSLAQGRANRPRSGKSGTISQNVPGTSIGQSLCLIRGAVLHAVHLARLESPWPPGDFDVRQAIQGVNACASLSIIVAATGLMFDGILAAGTESANRPAGLAIVSPTDGGTIENFLTAVLRWDYPLDKDLVPWWDISLEISRQADLSQPFIQCDLKDDVTEYRFAALPVTTYYWRITPFAIKDGQRVALVDAAAQGRFTTGKPLNRVGATDAERYRNPRRAPIGSTCRPCRMQKRNRFRPGMKSRLIARVLRPHSPRSATGFPCPSGMAIRMPWTPIGTAGTPCCASGPMRR